ncbi:MAG: hypothetical protein HYZ21_13015 [Chloroflexi bacterium]|nr:hypothetical protein [Chloroflexota bacterium]
MKFDFGEVLGRMWKIGWNHKVLWLWQMLPALTAIVFVPFFFLSNPFFLTSTLGPLNEFMSEPWVSIVFGLVTLLAFIPSIFLAVVIQLTTTYGAMKVEKGAEKLAFRELFTESLPYFWRILGLYAIFGGVWMVIWFGFMAFFMFTSIFTFGLGFICVIPFFLLLIPLLLVGYSVLELAQAAIVADDMGVVDAITHGWKLFRINWLGVVLLMLLLYVGMYIVSMMISLPMIFPMMMLPMGMNPMGLNPSSDVSPMISVLFLVFFTIMYMLMYVVQGILMTFFQSAWAVAYLRMNHNLNTPMILEKSSAEAGHGI